MASKRSPRFIHDVVADAGIKVNKPFALEQEDRRSFIRLEISAPMAINRIRDYAGNFWPKGDTEIVHGLILNVSAGGVLVDLDRPLHESDVVVMRFTLQEVEKIDNVLGLVKRVDHDDEGCIAGIEFITREGLFDRFTRAELELLPKTMVGFDESIRRVLNKYIQQERLTAVSGNGNECY